MGRGFRYAYAWEAGPAGGGGGGGIAHLASTSATPGSHGGATAAITTTGATLLVISVAYHLLGTAPTISDSKGNTWIARTLRSNTEAAQRIYYCLTPIVGTGHTFTALDSGSDCYPAIFAYAFSGVASYQTESGAAAPSGASLASGSVTPASNGALILTGVCGQNAVTDTVAPPGFTVLSKPAAAFVNKSGSAAWQVQTTAAPINPTWSFSPSQQYCAVATAVFLSS